MLEGTAQVIEHREMRMLLLGRRVRRRIVLHLRVSSAHDGSTLIDGHGAALGSSAADFNFFLARLTSRFARTGEPGETSRRRRFDVERCAFRFGRHRRWSQKTGNCRRRIRPFITGLARRFRLAGAGTGIGHVERYAALERLPSRCLRASGSPITKETGLFRLSHAIIRALHHLLALSQFI